MLITLKRKWYLLMVALMLTTLLPVAVPASAVAAVPVKTALKAVKKVPTIASISNITKTVVVDASVVLPSTVSATMSDKAKKTVPIKWDKTLNADVDGTFIANGAVSGYAKKVVYTLVVKAPKMGTIEIPKVTDSTIKKPTDIKLGIGKGQTWDSTESKKLDYTVPAVYWTPKSEEADEYIIRIYDQYKRMIADTGISSSEESFKKQGYFLLQLDKIKTLTISTVTITPVNTMGDGRQGGEGSNDKVGESAVFECAVKVTPKLGKQMTLRTQANENGADIYDLMLSDQVAPYQYFALRSEYRYPGSNAYCITNRGEFSAKDGRVSVHYVDSREFKERYVNLSAKLSLIVYSDATVEGSNKATYTVTYNPVVYTDNPLAKAAKAFEGVYKNGKQTIVVTTKGQDAEYFSGDLHVVQDFGNDVFFYLRSMFDGSKKISNATENGDGSVVTIELVLDGDTIHFTRIFHQENNQIEKLDFKKTKEDALKVYEAYYKQLYHK